MSVLSRLARLVSSLCHVPGRVPPQVGRSIVIPGGPGSLCCAWCPGSLGSASRARSPPRGLLLASHTSGPARVPVPPCRRPLPVALVAPPWSTSGPFRQGLSRGPARPLCLSPPSPPGPVESREPRAAASRSTAQTARKGEASSFRRRSGTAQEGQESATHAAAHQAFDVA